MNVTKSKGAANEEIKNQLARALADYDNLRKRIESERGETQKLVVGVTIGKLLPLYDMLLNLKEHNNDQGLEIVIKNYKSVLLDLGAEEIEVKKGDEFDPTIHEVGEVVESKDEKMQNKVFESLFAGWKFRDNGFVIRPARVKVYSAKSE